MGKVTGEKMTAAERRGDKTWYCQNDGSELDTRPATDPTGMLRCPTCGRSWWAALPPSADDVQERMEEIREADEADTRARDEARAAVEKSRKAEKR